MFYKNFPNYIGRISPQAEAAGGLLLAYVSFGLNLAVDKSFDPYRMWNEPLGEPLVYKMVGFSIPFLLFATHGITRMTRGR